MRSTLHLRALSVFIILVSLSSCAIQAPILSKFDVDKMEKSGKERLISGSVSVKNPNKLGLHIKQANFKLNSGPLSVGDASILGKHRLPMNETVLVPLQLKIANESLLLGGIQQLGQLITGGKAAVVIEGKIRVCTFGIFCKNYQVKEELKLKL